MRQALLLCFVLTACAGDLGNSGDDGMNDAGVPDGSIGWTISFDPIDPIASPILPIRAYLTLVNSQGVLTFDWSVRFNGSAVPFTEQASDGSQIGFLAADPGVYDVSVSISGPSACPYASTPITVTAPGANADLFRLRTVPSPSLAPPQETYLQVKGGGDANRAIALDPGIAVAGLVKDSATNTGVAAYLKFMPVSMPTAFSELFSASSGMYSLRLLPIDHDVLVIPSSPGLAPKLVRWTAVPLTTQLQVGPGTAVTGIVRGPSGVGFGGAKVQLYAGGVPSTIATTAADGTFSVRTDFPASATQVTMKVTPPAASGLPRLEATGAFDLGQSVQVRYAASLATCDLASTPVKRGGTNQPGARVTIVGSLPGVAGTVTAGVAVNATNSVRASATANGSGVLPARLVPRGALTAVTELVVPAQSLPDHAASALDTSACSVTAIDAPAMTQVNGTTKLDATTALANVRVEAEPVGDLALAGVAPVQVISSAAGAFSLPLAPGGRYTVRFVDPKQRAAPLVADDVAPAGVPTSAVLAKALSISGEVSVVNNANPVIGASIQILCATCTGLESARPIAETATDTISRYRIAVPDPGTM